MTQLFSYRFVDRTEQLVQRLDEKGNQWYFMLDDEFNEIQRAWKETEPLPEIEAHDPQVNYYNPS